MNAAAAAALEAVAVRLRESGIPFLLGGSGLLHALGLAVIVRDVDMVVPASERERVEAALAPGDWWRGLDTAPQGIFRSPWKAALEVGGVDVDVIGGLAYATEAERVVEMPFRPAGTWRCGSAEVPLAPPEHWLLLYERYRPERAAGLARVVSGDARARSLAELGP